MQEGWGGEDAEKEQEKVEPSLGEPPLAGTSPGEAGVEVSVEESAEGVCEEERC
jgi:hypothetical protein